MPGVRAAGVRPSLERQDDGRRLGALLGVLGEDRGEGVTALGEARRRPSWSQRQCDKYRIARTVFGLNGREASRVSNNFDCWAELILSRGRRLEEFGELGERRLGGRPRKNPERTARYWVLRGRGLSSADASRFSFSTGLYQDAVRRLDQGLPLRTSSGRSGRKEGRT